MRSIRSFSRAHTERERGYALVWALGLSVLFFMLIQLVLIDSSRELAEARRFRSQIVAAALAENGAELAAARLIDRPSADVSASDWQGTITGTMTHDLTSRKFHIVGDGLAKGVTPVKARVEVFGHVDENNVVHIDYTLHTP